MTARLVTINQCNDEEIIVYFDADVIIHAIRDARSPQLESLLRVKYALGRYSTTTLYEVAFARKKRGSDLSRLNRALPVTLVRDFLPLNFSLED